MNKDQLARLARHHKVAQTLDAYAPDVAAVPALARLATRFRQQLALLDGTATRNAKPAAGATATKNTASASLVARLVKVANALYLLYRSSGHTPEATKLLRHRTDYERLSEPELATEAASLSHQAAAHAHALAADYNLPAADLQALTTDVAGLITLQTAPQLAIDAAKLKGATARATLSALNRFLKDDFRAGLELLRDTHPAAYAALREATQVDDAAGSRATSEGKPAVERLAPPDFTRRYRAVRDTQWCANPNAAHPIFGDIAQGEEVLLAADPDPDANWVPARFHDARCFIHPIDFEVVR